MQEFIIEEFEMQFKETIRRLTAWKSFNNAVAKTRTTAAFVKLFQCEHQLIELQRSVFFVVSTPY